MVTTSNDYSFTNRRSSINKKSTGYLIAVFFKKKEHASTYNAIAFGAAQTSVAFKKVRLAMHDNPASPQEEGQHAQSKCQCDIT